MVSNRPVRRAAFSLISLLVLLAIIAMLLAFLLPAVVRVRQAAGRSESINNLRQIGLACHGFHDAYKTFPPAVGTVNSVHGTVHFFLLPFIEQDPLFRRGAKGPGDNAVHSQRVPTYLCPEDKSAPPDNLYKGWLATTNYAANWLTFKDGKVRITDIADGTSNTFLFAQRYQMCRGTPCAWGYDELYEWAPVFAYFSQAKFQDAPLQGACDPALAQAIESGHIQVGFADGSVRTINHSVSSHTWWYGCDPADGNPVDFDN